MNIQTYINKYGSKLKRHFWKNVQRVEDINKGEENSIGAEVRGYAELQGFHLIEGCVWSPPEDRKNFQGVYTFIGWDPNDKIIKWMVLITVKNFAPNYCRKCHKE